MAVAALCTTGCLGSSGGGTRATTEPDRAIAGTLWMSGGPAPGHRRLRHTGLRVYEAGRMVATTPTDGRGRFHLALPPGRYQLEADGMELLPRRVDVAPNETARIRLTLSVK